MVVFRSLAELPGELFYLTSDQSFWFKQSPSLESDVLTRETALTLGTLQIWVDIETRRLLYIDGFHPRASWLEVSLNRPRLVPGVVIVETDEQLETGIAVEIAGAGDWLTRFDSTTGWVVFTSPRWTGEEEVVQIAQDQGLALAAGGLAALWLKPTFR